MSALDDDLSRDLAGEPISELAGAQPAGDGDEPPVETGPTTQFTDHADFFERFLRNVVERPVNRSGGRGLRWDPDWQRHPEVVLRLDALWKAFEAATASKDLGAMSRWWIYDFDPHMRVLLDGETGPMSIDHVAGDVYPPLPGGKDQ